jgi:hypothetical protein
MFAPCQRGPQFAVGLLCFVAVCTTHWAPGKSALFFPMRRHIFSRAVASRGEKCSMERNLSALLVLGQRGEVARLIFFDTQPGA